MLPRGSALAFVLAGGLTILAACSPPPDRGAGEPSLRVRLLTSMPDSGRWERASERGLGRIAAEFGAEVARLRVSGSDQLRRWVAMQGSSGIDVVFCVGAGFENAVFSEAPAFPATRFVLLSGRGFGPNVAGLEIVPEGAAWSAGVVAATLTTSESVGVIRGAGGPWLDHVENGFIKGFLSATRNGNALVVSVPEGPWELAGRGVSVALVAADEHDAGTYAAAHDAGVLLVATDEAMVDREPDVVAAAISVDLAEAMVRVTRDVVDGTFAGGLYAFDLGSGVLGVRLNPTMPDVNRPEVRDALDRARSEVTAGIVEMEELGI